MTALASLAVPSLHVYAQPKDTEYLQAQQSFAEGRAWFQVRRLGGVSHFPALETPQELTDAVLSFTDRFEAEPTAAGWSNPRCA